MQDDEPSAEPVGLAQVKISKTDSKPPSGEKPTPRTKPPSPSSRYSGPPRKVDRVKIGENTVNIADLLASRSAEEVSGFSTEARRMDLDKDGQIQAAELAELLRRYMSSKKERKKLQMIALGLLIACLVQTCLLTTVVCVVAYEFKDAYVDSSSAPAAPPTGPMMTSRGGDVIGMREALISVPLWATTALPLDQLQRVKYLQVSYDPDGKDGKGPVQSLLHVAEVRKRSATDITFVSHTPGRSVVVSNGRSYLEDLASVTAAELGKPLYVRTPLCVADTECSALQIDGADVAELERVAGRALEAAGFAAPSPRRLAVSQDPGCPDGSNCSACCKEEGCQLVPDRINWGPHPKCVVDPSKKWGGDASTCAACEKVDECGVDFCEAEMAVIRDRLETKLLRNRSSLEECCQAKWDTFGCLLTGGDQNKECELTSGPGPHRALQEQLTSWQECDACNALMEAEEQAMSPPAYEEYVVDLRSLEPSRGGPSWCRWCDEQDDPYECCDNTFLYWPDANEDAPPHSVSRCEMINEGVPGKDKCRMKDQVYKCGHWPPPPPPPAPVCLEWS